MHCVQNLKLTVTRDLVDGQWHPPSLEETLQASEGEHKLRKPYSVGLISGLAASGEVRVPPVEHAGAVSGAARGLLHGVAAHLFTLLPVLDEEMYWREWLERTMNGPVVAAVIGVLIFSDVLRLVYFEAALTGDDTSVALVACSAAVLLLFMLELALRNLAQGRRFWRAADNVFDAIVVGASVIMAAINRTYESRILQAPPDSPQRAELRGTTDILKVFS